MKLMWSSRSPFVRKVMVAAREVGVAGRIATVRAGREARQGTSAAVQRTRQGGEA
jgi:glutathione S-transferase